MRSPRKGTQIRESTRDQSDHHLQAAQGPVRDEGEDKWPTCGGTTPRNDR